VVVLEIAFATDDFGFNLVARHSSTTTPALLKLTAMWSSQEGSLLLWAWVLSIVSSLALYSTRRRLREIVPYATAVLMGVAAFFCGLMIFGGNVNPFTASDPVPVEGNGLQPLLRHWAMMIHPPMLYTGYVAFTVPFAFAVGALITRRLDATWIRATRRFSLIAWTFLGIGLLLGAFWSYEELGWGGYWAWDPVENAAMMPWLIGTAFLHSVMVQEKRGMLKVWNVALIIATFALCLTGTFLVRSGVLQSIHAFGDSTVGPYILALIATVVLGSTALLIARLDDLRSTKRIESLFSREAVFLINNLLLVGMCAVVFWGTFFPLIAELFTGNKSTLAAPWFDRYTTPLAILLVLFTGAGPLLTWRGMSKQALKRVYRLPLAAAVIAAVLLAIFTDATKNLWAFAMFVLAAFAIVALGQEFWRGAKARRSVAGGSMPAALLSVVVRNRRRYGGYIVHFGIVFMLVGVAASSSFQTKRDITLSPGESAEVAGYTFTYRQPTADVTNERIRFGAILEVDRDGERVAVLHPSRDYFRPNGEPAGPISSYFEGEATSEIGVDTGIRRDVWTAFQPNLLDLQKSIDGADRGFRQCLQGAEGTPDACKTLVRMMRQAAQNPELRELALAQIAQLQGTTIRRVAESFRDDEMPASFRILINPIVTWMWIGALIAIAGALIAVWPGAGARRRRVSGLAAARRAGKGAVSTAGEAAGGEAEGEGGGEAPTPDRAGAEA
jgi:cytochrome c-type biogenesis protein CcmF